MNQPQAVPAVDVALRDGSTVRVRPITEADQDELHALLSELSSESRWLRFFSASADLEKMAQWAATSGGGRGYGVVAVAGEAERIVGHAAYVRDGGDQAEIAFEVSEDRHGLGIATILLAHLAEAAQRDDIRSFVATVHPSNHRMAKVFRDSGFAVEVKTGPGLLRFEFPTSLDADAIAAFEDRDRIAAEAAVAHVLRPASVALIGASRRPGTVGAALLDNLAGAGFSGTLHVVHPSAESIAGLRAYRSIADVPGPVDLAVVAVPASEVPAVARACGAAGVRALVVVSAGLSEAGEGALQAELLAACRAGGMRLVGPNCLGVLATRGGLNATFAPQSSSPGRIAFASQSGGFGIAAIAETARRGLGLSSFVSMGNKADLSGNDFLRFWAHDPHTDVIALYLESFGNPRRFGQIARRVAADKPVVAVKSGRSAAGARAAASHTGALLAASDVTVDALFAHAGVIRTDTIGEQFDAAALLVAQPLPGGDRVAIVTNAGGPGIACVDACAAAGLRVEPLPPAVRRRLRKALPAHASVGNPVDMIASATPEDFRRTIERVAAEPEVDAVIAIFVPPLVTRAPDVAAAIRAAETGSTPLLGVFMSATDAERSALAGDGAVPVYATPEEAARALGHVTRYAAWRRSGPDAPRAFTDTDPDAVAAVLAEALARDDDGPPRGNTSAPPERDDDGPPRGNTSAPLERDDDGPPRGATPAPLERDDDGVSRGAAPRDGRGEIWLDPRDVEAVLRAYGIPLVESRFAKTAAAAGRCAAELGGPVAVKAVAPRLVHKADVGGVALGLTGATAVTRAARAMGAQLRAAGHEPRGFLVQRMAPPGTELIVGIVGDPDFGPVVACGAGGHAVELLGDVAVRLAPLGPRAAAELLRSLRTFPLLDGYRGAPRADVDAVEDVLQRIAALAADHPEIGELDCNPVLVSPAGAVVLDARIRVAAPAAPRPYPSLDR